MFIRKDADSMGKTGQSRPLPIGIDSFRELRENDYYYVDKTLMIRDFIKFRDKVALITRPRRFGKTLNMSMLNDFFDITQDSRAIFGGLKIMDTEYADQINTRPVVYFTMKGCSGNTMEELRKGFCDTLYDVFLHFYEILDNRDIRNNARCQRYFMLYNILRNGTASFIDLRSSLNYLVMAVEEYYHKPVLLLIDEYDQPILSAYEGGYREELNDFFAEFYGCVLKGNILVSQALLTGIQRVAKESIFSRLNNICVYSVLDTQYEEYFGLAEDETKCALSDYGYELNADVKSMYNGYVFGHVNIYNPWSILCYLNKGNLEPYWVNTSTNTLIRTAMKQTGLPDSLEFEQLLTNQSVEVIAQLEASYIELGNHETLWGLLINSGYLTVKRHWSSIAQWYEVTVPNGEVAMEFRKIVAEFGRLNDNSLTKMLNSLVTLDMDTFEKQYQELTLVLTSSHDAANENAYHMLMLGICAGLSRYYRISSNQESGLGRSDIRMESVWKDYPHIIIEFKHDREAALETMGKKALEQILDKQYHAGLHGKVLCLGIAHKGKECAMEYKVIEN